MPQDPKVSRFLVIYSILTTLFCFYFIHLAKFNTRSCLPAVESNPIIDLADGLSSPVATTPPSDVTKHSPSPSASASSSPSFVHNPLNDLKPGEFPRRLWQTAKTSAAGLGEDERMQIQSWVTQNQKYRYEIITKHSAESYVQEHFSDRPEIYDTFMDLQDNMMRADLVKYLALYGDGGVYSDLDTVLLKPIDQWIPYEYRGKVNLVVGVEYDTLGGARWGDWTLDLQFASWAIQAMPGHMAFDIALKSGTSRLRKLASEQGKSVADMKAYYKEVLDSTGPALFTRSVIEAIGIQTNTYFDWHNISGMTEPRLYGDILILPINAFGSGQQHSNSGSPDDDDAFVHHLFAGSWKAAHPFKDQMLKEEEEKKKQGSGN